jgi:hypothetical protein
MFSLMVFSELRHLLEIGRFRCIGIQNPLYILLMNDQIVAIA